MKYRRACPKRLCHDELLRNAEKNTGTD
uniref:Uncharacterized protein n=1 Tax=Anguilla anguilla TaxID=7936 RepID=A0A0E9QTT0_ANGAN